MNGQEMRRQHLSLQARVPYRTLHSSRNICLLTLLKLVSSASAILHFDYLNLSLKMTKFKRKDTEQRSVITWPYRRSNCPLKYSYVSSVQLMQTRYIGPFTRKTTWFWPGNLIFKMVVIFLSAVILIIIFYTWLISLINISNDNVSEENTYLVES